MSKLKDIDCPTCLGHGVVKEKGKQVICSECGGLTYIYIEDDPKPKRKTRVGNDYHERYQ